MNIIYVVTSGIYSDYHIKAVFSDKEEAEYLTDILNANNYDEARIEEYPLDRYDKYGIKNMCYWPFRYYPETDKWENGFYVGKTAYGDFDVNVVEKREPFGGLPGYYSVYVQAKTRDAALKIANEKIMMAIAKGK